MRKHRTPGVLVTSCATEHNLKALRCLSHGVPKSGRGHCALRSGEGSGCSATEAVGWSTQSLLMKANEGRPPGVACRQDFHASARSRKPGVGRRYALPLLRLPRLDSTAPRTSFALENERPRWPKDRGDARRPDRCRNHAPRINTCHASSRREKGLSRGKRRENTV